MDKRSNAKKYFENEDNKKLSDRRFNDRSIQLDKLNDSLKKDISNAFGSLILYLDGKTTKTEVINQLKSISTPDVDKAVLAIDKLRDDVKNSKVDIKPLQDVMNKAVRELSLIPKQQAKFEQKDEIKVSNLKDIDFSVFEKTIDAIKGIKLEAPNVTVKPASVTVQPVDLSPLETVLKSVLKAVKENAPKDITIPKTNLTKLEKGQEQSNKLLKTISEKNFGGGGGGGNGSPYIDNTGKIVNVELSNGRIPIDIDMAIEDIATETTLAKLPGLSIPIHDYISASYDDGIFTETYTFKTGGSGGTTVSTITVVYTDATKVKLVSVTKS